MSATRLFSAVCQAGIVVWMTAVSGVAVTMVVTVVVAVLAHSRSGARVGVFLSASLLPLPMLVTGVANLRVFLAFLIAASLARAIDYAYGPAPNGLASRFAYSFGFLALLDTLPSSRRARFFDRRSTVRLAAAGTLAAAAIASWPVTQSLPPLLRVAVRCVIAATVFLSMAEVVTAVVRIVTASCGVELPAVHEAPYRARTLNEFWSSRWNLATARWLRRHCFARLARRGTGVALWATFAASAALHVYLITGVADAGSILSWAAFFLAQPLLIQCERRLQVRRWPVAAGRAWTMTTLMLLSPLLFGPFLDLFGASL